MKSPFRRLFVAAVAFAVAPTFPVYAQQKRGATQTKTQKAQQPAAATKAPAAEAKKDPEERKGPAAMQPSGPNVKDFDETKAAAADKKRDEAIEALKRIIPRIEDGSPQKADLLFQLAELYWEKQKYLALKANAKYSKDIEAANEAQNRGEKVADPKLDLRESELYRSETMRLYETILRDYPAYNRKDEVLFALGYNLYELNKKGDAVKRYEELVKNYPESRFLSDTYVQLANHWFDNNQLAKAKENYEKALKTNNPEVYGYALYKLAWCDFNAGDHVAGLDKFHKVVEFSEKQGKGGAILKNEALRDMVLTYVQLNRADDAVDYFKRKAPKNRQSRLISALANQLADAGHHENAIKVFRGLINDEPNRAEAPDFQQSIIKSYEKLRQRDQVRAEVKKLAELYRPGSGWWKANESRPPVLKQAFEVSEEAMRSVVTEYHQEAQKTKQVETYRLARDIYRQYIDSFASSADVNFVSDHAFSMLYYYGDILWALEEWQPAAEIYERVVAFQVPERELAKELFNAEWKMQAAYNAILGYEKLVKIERGELKETELKDGQKVDEKKKKGEVERKKQLTKRTAKELEAQPLTKYEQKLVEVCDKFVGLYPGNKDEIDVRYQAAVTFYDKNHFVDAGRRLTEIINKWPEERRSKDAADLTMGILEEKEEWLELNKSARTFAANKKLMSGSGKDAQEFIKRVNNVVEGSQYKYVDEVVYKKEKNPARAAELFLEFVKEFPKSDNADRALTYTVFIFQDALQLDRGIEAGERVLKEYPQSPFELKVRYALAKFYEQTAQFRKSAEMNEAFIAATDLATGVTKPAAAKGRAPARGKAAEKKTVLSAEELKGLHDEAKGWLSDAHFNAALWWEGLGEYEKAVTAWNTYMTRFKDAKDIPDIHFNIGMIYDRQKKTAEALKHFESFNKTFDKDKRTTAAQHYRAKYRQWMAHRDLKNETELKRLQTDLLRSYAQLPAEDKKDRRVLNAYAHMRFLDSEAQWKSYTDIKFTKVSTLKKDFGAKQKRIQDIEKMYTEILAIGDGEYGIAALTRIGLAYADFAQNIVSSPDPRGLDEEQLDMYRSELENMAFPLEEKAIEALEKATDKAYELNIYNDWTLMAQDRINKYRPGFYAKAVPVQTFQGSEFFVTAPVQKSFSTAKVAQPAPAPAPAKETETVPAKGEQKAQETTSTQPAAAKR